MNAELEVDRLKRHDCVHVNLTIIRFNDHAFQYGKGVLSKIRHRNALFVMIGVKKDPIKNKNPIQERTHGGSSRYAMTI